MSDEAKLREEICVVGASLYARGHAVGSAGNISARLPDGWLITPTDACLGRLDPNDIAKVGLDGQPVSGGKPSKRLHCIAASTHAMPKRTASSTRIRRISSR